jgi:DNA-binding MarR family transcriptional regulator
MQLSAAKPRLTSEGKSKQPSAGQPKPARGAKTKNVAPQVSERQTAVLKALRSMMDKKHRVEVRGAELAKASSIPQGPLHSVLASLEKKQMIRTERPGSAKLRTVYEVLESPHQSTRSVNRAAHGKAAHPARTGVQAR